MKPKEVCITQLDMERLRAHIAVSGGDSADVLEQKLASARIVCSKDVPGDTITMNSVVRIRYVDTGEEHTFALVFPGIGLKPTRYPLWVGRAQLFSVAGEGCRGVAGPGGEEKSAGT
jgi:hypothetical protein